MYVPIYFLSLPPCAVPPIGPRSPSLDKNYDTIVVWVQIELFVAWVAFSFIDDAFSLQQLKLSESCCCGSVLAHGYVKSSWRGKSGQIWDFYTFHKFKAFLICDFVILKGKSLGPLEWVGMSWIDIRSGGKVFVVSLKKYQHWETPSCPCKKTPSLQHSCKKYPQPFPALETQHRALCLALYMYTRQCSTATLPYSHLFTSLQTCLATKVALCPVDPTELRLCNSTPSSVSRSRQPFTLS